MARTGLARPGGPFNLESQVHLERTVGSLGPLLISIDLGMILTTIYYLLLNHTLLMDYPSLSFLLDLAISQTGQVDTADSR